MEELKSYLNGIVCATCLTSDRELHHIQDLPKIQELLPDIHLNAEEDKVCWECVSSLKKFIKFRQKASEAQQMFTNFVEGKLTSIKSFSKLKWEIMVDGVKIVTEDQSSRVEIQSEENQENDEENEESEEKNANNTLYEEMKHGDDEEYGVNYGFNGSRENSQTELSYGLKMEIDESTLNTEDSIRNYDDDEDLLIQNLPENFNIDDEETNKLIENTLEAFLQDLTVRKKTKVIRKNSEIIDSDHGVNENEDSYIELQAQCRKSIDIPKGRALNRYKNVSRRKITKEEMEQMLERERENNCYKNAYFKCEKCVYGYDNVNQYTDHLVKHDEKQGSEICSICDQRFPTRKTAMDHYLHHFMAFYCTECGYTSRFLRFLKAHQEKKECRSKTYPIWFYCDECDQKFALESLLTHHKKSIHQVKYSCKYCNKTFTKDYSRKLHEQIHKGRQSVQCDICKKFFVNKVSFQFHLKNVHDFTIR
ncbi:zinc finger protein 510-like isoform X2 [Plodia interpunctella]|uniref:zinc finger protein 510-like isoform X2 n=1 Tax=Plodia interpunctella TaxID=58824 RepID=UPI0023684C2A|nr:zinc finger protein 510-like isoform X2 [Plodia interpunctella]